MTDVGSTKRPSSSADRRPALRRRPPAGRRRDRGRRARARRPVRGRDLVPDADPEHARDPLRAPAPADHAASARGRRRSTPTRTTRDGVRSRTCRTCSPTCSSRRPRGCSRAEGERLPATGPSFRDATRVAGANTALWRDIYLRQRATRWSRAIDDAIARLGAVPRRCSRRRRGRASRRWNDAAREDRRRLLEADLAGGEVHELRVHGAEPPGDRRRDRARARPCERSTSSTWRCTRRAARTARSRCGSAAARRRAAGARALVGRARASR